MSFVSADRRKLIVRMCFSSHMTGCVPCLNLNDVAMGVYTAVAVTAEVVSGLGNALALTKSLINEVPLRWRIAVNPRN